jgi:hypothetical protein
MADPITWHLQDNRLQHLSSDLNGWSAQIWDYGSHPSRLPHLGVDPFNWSVSPSMALVDAAEREGYAPTLAEAQRVAERHLRELAAKPAPRDEFLAALAQAMPPGACDNWGG